MTFCAKPWRLPTGFLIAGGLILVGLMLQLSLGAVDWTLFAWPVNIVALASLLVVITVMHLLRRRVYAFGFLSTYAAAVPALLCAVVLTFVMGVTRQEPEGSWFSDMLSFWPFVLAYTYIVVILGMVILRRLSRMGKGIVSNVVFLLNHLGLFIALTTATLGNADMQRLQMWTTNNAPLANMLSGSESFRQYERFALDETGKMVELPLAIELKRFIMELYADSITPRRYASEVLIYSKISNQLYAGTIDVNRPAKVDGWTIYQKDYRITELGDACQISILELVSDPWLPWVYAGIYMMIGGAVGLFVLGERKKRKSLNVD